MLEKFKPTFIIHDDVSINKFKRLMYARKIRREVLGRNHPVSDLQYSNSIIKSLGIRVDESHSVNENISVTYIHECPKIFYNKICKISFIFSKNGDLLKEDKLCQK